MKLSKLYTNFDNRFEPILFRDGLNVVLAEIRLPQNRDRDTHNLGKTTLGKVIDFCLLQGRDKNFFLFKHYDLFKDFVFFLEIKLFGNDYLTIRRSVETPSKISFKHHKEQYSDYSRLPQEGWDHYNVSFDNSKVILDGDLNLRAISPFHFRNCLGYFLRSQGDYLDVFQLGKFSSRHADWKPYLAHILGFDAKSISSHYRAEEELESQEVVRQNIQRELGGSIQDLSKIKGLLLLKKKDLQKKQELLDAFDFRDHDKETTKLLVSDIDEKISLLNAERYSLQKSKNRIESSLKDDEVLFNPEEARELYSEAGVLFDGQIKKDFEQLIKFNKAITEERLQYLREELEEVKNQISSTNSELSQLNSKRIKSLSYLKKTDVFEKYKGFTNDIVVLKSDIRILENQQGFLERLSDIREKIRDLEKEKSDLQLEIETNVEKQNADDESLFSKVRVYFSEIIEEVLNRKALLSVSPNRLGHIVFKTEILDEQGFSTSADDGTSYKKLLCVAFDMAILKAYSEEKFPRFVYHDGVFESLDNRKKRNLLDVIRSSSSSGIQHIITLIDSDLPPNSDNESQPFLSSEIVLTLHDEGDRGRLFKMRSW